MLQANAPLGPLHGLAFFAGVPAAKVAEFSTRATVSSLKAHENLVVAEDPRTRIWFLRTGWARLRVHSPGGTEVTTAIAGPGELVSCAGEFGLDKHPCTITTLTDVDVIGLPAVHFEKWLKADPAAAYRMIELLRERLTESVTLKAINAERAPLRLRLTLGWLSRKFGTEIPATRALLADLTGLRAETCSRVLSDFKRRGVLRVHPRRISILRPERLSAGRP